MSLEGKQYFGINFKIGVLQQLKEIASGSGSGTHVTDLIRQSVDEFLERKAAEKDCK